MAIDLNADVGEAIGDDEGVLPFVSSANVACGFHAGNPTIMRSTVQLAHGLGVAIGAHPSFEDREGFGRREMQLGAADLERLVAYQIGALAGVAGALGIRLSHVKPHGALYNMAIRDRALSDAIAAAIASFDRSLILFALPGTELMNAGKAAGLQVAAEGFADRSYEADGSLTPRTRSGAVIHNADEAIGRAIRMARDGVVRAVNGSDIPMRVDTICTHGDTPGSNELTRQLRAALEAAGIEVKPIGPRRTTDA